jgi:predicted transcriptional regulator
MEGSLLQRLLVVNVILVVFNLLPAFPMDGGRVVRALLATRLEYTRATQIAASLGQSAAFILGMIGLFYNPLLIFTALFVWIGAAQEASMVRVQTALEGIPVSRAMLTDFRVLDARDPLNRAVDLILAGWQQDFPVVDNGDIQGVLTRNDLIVALQQRGQHASVGDVMQRDIVLVDPGDMLESVQARLQECNCHTIPVAREGRLVGLITMDNIGEFLMIRSALKRAMNGRELGRA